MCNYIVSAFVRNDGDPSLAMVATLSSSLFNVVFDYIFMFPMGLGPVSYTHLRPGWAVLLTRFPRSARALAAHRPTCARPLPGWAAKVLFLSLIHI